MYLFYVHNTETHYILGQRTEGSSLHKNGFIFYFYHQSETC